MKLMTFEEEVTERVTARVTEEVTERVTEKVTEEVREKTIAEFNDKPVRSLIGLGSLTNEQIATVTNQTPEYVASLRLELEATH